METDNKRSAMMLLPLLIVFITLLSVIFEGGNTTPLVASSLFMKRVIDITACIALVSSALYVITGFKKESAKYFKLFLYSFTALKLLSLIDMTIMHVSYRKGGGVLTPHMLMMNIMLLLVVLLLISFLIMKDIGRKISLARSYFILAVHFVYFMYPLIMEFGQEGTINVIIRWFTGVSLSLVLIVMQQLKYHDKQERNTK